MTKDTVFDTLRSIISDYLLFVSREEIFLESNLLNDLGMDSIDVISIVMQVDVRFGIKITEDEVSDLVTVSDIVDVVMKRLDTSV